MSWIDVSVPLETGMIRFPGDPEVKFTRVKDLDSGDDWTVSMMEMGSHTGTHVDAPLHMIKGHKVGIDLFPPDVGIGPARVIHVEKAGEITVDDLTPHDIREGQRILFRTRNSDHNWPALPFDEGFAHVTLPAARYLAERRVLLVGSDYLSIGSGENNIPVHQVLLGSGAWILEGLVLCDVAAGDYDLYAMPLRFAHGDGAPVHALLRPRAAA